MGDWLLQANGGCLATNQSIFDPVSPGGESIRDLAILVLSITGIIFLVVEGVLLYCVVRFRRRAAAQKDPPQVYGSKPIEIAWTAAPALVVFVLVLVTARTLWEVDAPPPEPRAGDNTLFVTVIGRQWWWEYHYDHYNGKPIRAVGPDGKETDLPVITANELHFPASESGVPRPVYLTLKSADVCHSFWVPQLGGKTDLIPGRVNSMWFQTDKPGLYLGQCAEYCGTQHAKMLIRVVVDSPRDFEKWLENQRKPAAEIPAGKSGRSAFLAQSCISCHRVRGTPAKGDYAPDLTHLMSRATIASGALPNTPENLKAWLEDPQTLKPGCLMPAFRLTAREYDDIVNYLLTLR
jgi:cytochrome c oxidase subunit 2